MAVLRGDRRQFRGHPLQIVSGIREDLFATERAHERIREFVVLARVLLLGTQARTLEQTGGGLGELRLRESVKHRTAQFLFDQGERRLPLVGLALGIHAVVLDELEHVEVVGLGFHHG